MQAPMACFSCGKDYSDKVDKWRQAKSDSSNDGLSNKQLMLKLFAHPKDPSKIDLCDYCIGSLLTDVSTVKKIAYFNPPVRVPAPIRR